MLLLLGNSRMGKPSRFKRQVHQAFDPHPLSPHTLEITLDLQATLDEDAPHAKEKKTMAQLTIYISYAWGDAQERGGSREDIVDRLYEGLSTTGYTVKRDKMALSYKGLAVYPHDSAR